MATFIGIGDRNHPENALDSFIGRSLSNSFILRAIT
jgi:hypothetical protein